MKNEKQILEELKEICPLIIQIEKKEVYSVPSFYFNNLSSEIIDNAKLNKEYAYFLGSSARYSIPENYFKNLADIILQKILTDQKIPGEVFKEMEDLAPLLNTISKKPVFSVPVNYFDKIQLPSVESPKRKAKVVSIRKRSRFFKFAAAAVIIPFLAVGVYTLTAKEFLRSNNSKAKDEMKTLSKEEIVNYLKKTTSTENASSASQKTSINDDEIKSSLKQVSDKEIQQFLKETPESDEI